MKQLRGGLRSTCHPFVFVQYLLLFLREIILQNQRFSAEVLGSLRQLNLAGVRMTPLKCTVVAAVLGSGRHALDEVNLASCQLDPAGLRTLMPVLLRARKLG